MVRMIAIEIFRYKAEPVCPQCGSGNLDLKFSYMGDYSCKHCDYFWRKK